MKLNPMPLSVQLLAMSQSSQRNISGFMKTKGKTHFKLSNSQPTEVVLIDIDNKEGKDLLFSYQNSQTSTQIIALTLSPSKEICSPIIQIQKPITGIELIRAAEKIKERVSKNLISKKLVSQEQINDGLVTRQDKNALATKVESDEVQYYEPSSTLQGMLRRAVQLSDKEKTPVVLHIQHHRIELNMANNQAYLNFPKSRLRNLCFFPLNTSTCRIEKESLGYSSEQQIAIPIAELSWNVALLCSRGRSAKNLDDESHYQLKRWPNLTRWSVPNNALRIASLWSKSPNSITTIAQQLSIPISDVRCFISAALDSQIAIVCEKESEVIPFKAKNKNSVLFKKLLNRLKRA